MPRCFFCGDPAAHPATGAQRTENVLACRKCAKELEEWQRQRERGRPRGGKGPSFYDYAYTEHQRVKKNARKRKAPSAQMAFKGFSAILADPGPVSTLAAEPPLSPAEEPEHGRYGLRARGRYDALLERKRDALEKILHVRLANIIACGAYGCVIKANNGRVLKLTQLQEEGEFWAFTREQQKLGDEIANEGIVRVDDVSILIDDDTGEAFIAVLRADATPAFRIVHGTRGMTEMHPTAITAKRGGPQDFDDWLVSAEQEGLNEPAQWSLEELAFYYPDLARPARGAVQAELEFALGDVHLGNVGWEGRRIVIFDATGYFPPRQPPKHMHFNRRRR